MELYNQKEKKKRNNLKKQLILSVKISLQ